MGKKGRSDIVLDYSNMMTQAVGPDHGILQGELDGLKERAAVAHARLADLKKSGKIGFFTQHEMDTKPIKKYAAKVREKYENFVVLGIGGSALGTLAVNQAINHSFSHLLTKRKRNGYPRLFVADNIDPDQFHDLLKVTDPKKSIYNVISKSGTTAETMSQFMIVVDMLNNALKGKWKKRMVVTTDPAKGLLREIVNEHKLESFEVPPNVGGRFSVFSAVGLLPLACAGVDIDELLAGAARMAERCAEPDLNKNPAYLFASLMYLADTTRKKPMLVMMAYSSKLYGIADWFRQLWAESLGKRYSLDKKEVHTGQTPIKALGATDQHSQVQLYVEGPHDKVVVFLEVESFKETMGIPHAMAGKPELAYLAGQSLNALIKTEMEGTQYALTTHHRPNMAIRLPELSEYTLGQIIYLLEHATAFAGGLYNIDPFDQPGVEFGKNYAYAMMGRAGYEGLKAEIKQKLGNIPSRTL